MAKYYFVPDTDLPLWELLDLIAIEGVGNILNEHGDQTSWSDEVLETAFLERGYEIDRKSVQNWRLHKNLPRPENLRALARVISLDEPMREAWTRKLLAAREVEARLRRQSKENAEPSLTGSKKAPAGGSKTGQTGLRPRKRISILTVAAIMLPFAGILAYFLLANRSAEATDLKVCNEASFSKEKKTCLTAVRNFPADTKRIWISFDLQNVDAGEAFTRKWYRHGRLIHQKTSHNISPWEGWTWMEDFRVLGEGRYTLSVVVRGQVVSTDFAVGEAKPNAEFD